MTVKEFRDITKQLWKERFFDRLKDFSKKLRNET